MARIADSAHFGYCEDCGEPLTRPGSRKCYNCFQKQRPAASREDSRDRGRERRPEGARPAPSGLGERFGAYLSDLESRGYFGENDKLRCELVVRDAEVAGRMLAGAQITASQFRRFFTMARSLEQQLARGPTAEEAFAGIVPALAGFQPLVANLVGREATSAGRDRLRALKDFIDVNVEQARRSPKAFQEGFLPHFQYVLCYFTFHKDGP